MESITTSDISTYSKFEEVYIRLRNSENRIFSDEEVLQLPNVSRRHPHYREWKIRKQSANKLLKYLKSYKRPLTILEVGCGNGWLSAFLSHINQIEITSIDVNRLELNQAKRLFADKRNIQFIEGSIEDIEPGITYDIILFASAIQYFSSLQTIIQQSLQLLKAQGEIHIVDTIFYPKNEVEEARKRSSAYFNEKGQKEMSRYYYHHKLEDLKSFNITILKRPTTTFNRLLMLNHPFYWLRIKP